MLPFISILLRLPKEIPERTQTQHCMSALQAVKIRPDCGKIVMRYKMPIIL